MRITGETMAPLPPLLRTFPLMPATHPFLGVPADIIAELVEPLKKGLAPCRQTIGVFLEYMSLTQLRVMGLDDESKCLLTIDSKAHDVYVFRFRSVCVWVFASAGLTVACVFFAAVPGTKELEDVVDAQSLHRQALVVSGRWGESPAAKLLEDGDVLLAIDGKTVITCRDVDHAIKVSAEPGPRVALRGCQGRVCVW